MRQLFRPAIWETGWQPPRDPMTAVFAGAMAIGGLSSAGASIAQGTQASAIANYNAALLSQRADQAEAEARARADMDARLGARRLGATGAAFGASGVVANTGSALDVMADQATENALQVALDIYHGNVEATGLRTQANLTRMGGYAASDAGYAQAGRTLLSTGLSLGMMGYKAGLFGGGGGGTVPEVGSGTGITY